MRFAVLVLALAACTDPGEPTDTDTKAILAFRADLARVERETSEYVVRMTRANASTCVGLRNTYRLDANQIINFQMKDVAAVLDQMIVDRGGGAYADIACITHALDAALARHIDTECAVDSYGAEALSYYGTDAVLIDRAYARTDELLTGSAFAAPLACP